MHSIYVKPQTLPFRPYSIDEDLCLATPHHYPDLRVNKLGQVFAFDSEGALVYPLACDTWTERVIAVEDQAASRGGLDVANLVASAFLDCTGVYREGLDEDVIQANFIDGDRQNVHPSNLRWSLTWNGFDLVTERLGKERQARRDAARKAGVTGFDLLCVR